jgi:hypothetical protein
MRAWENDAKLLFKGTDLFSGPLGDAGAWREDGELVRSMQGFFSKGQTFFPVVIFYTI